MNYRKFLKDSLLLFSSIMFYSKKSMILYLHDVHKDNVYAVNDASMDINLFAKIVDVIRKSDFHIVPTITSINNQVMICFDDGYRGIWECKDFFIDNQVFPTIFLATELIGKPNYLNNDEIQCLLRKGFRFQSHTVNHICLAGLDSAELKHQLIDSKECLQKILQYPITEICFPMGYFDRSSVNAATGLYQIIYSSVPGKYFNPLPNGMITRNLIQSMTPWEVKRTLFGGQQIFRKRILKQHSKNK